MAGTPHFFKRKKRGVQLMVVLGLIADGFACGTNCTKSTDSIRTSLPTIQTSLLLCLAFITPDISKGTRAFLNIKSGFFNRHRKERDSFCIKQQNISNSAQFFQIKLSSILM